MQVHIDRGGERFGPYSVEQINAHLADGSILPSDLGWTDGMADWVPVTQVPGVTTADAAAPPPPPAIPDASPTAVGSTCPTCQVPVTADQVVCMGCGTNLQSGQTPALQTTSKSAGNKKLLIGVGAGVGVLALAATGYFVIYPKLSGDESNQESSNIGGNESTTPMPGDPGFGPGMGPQPGGGFAGGQGGRPQGGFGGQGGGQKADFGGKGRPPQGGGFNPMMFDKNKDGKVSKAEVPPQMGRMFDGLDKNRDGFLDQTEIKSLGAGMGRPQGGGQQGGFGGKGRPQGGVDPTTGLPPVGGGGLGGQGGRPQGGGQKGGKGRPQGGGQKGGKGRPQGGGVPGGLPPSGIPGQGQPQPR